RQHSHTEGKQQHSPNKKQQISFHDVPLLPAPTLLRRMKRQTVECNASTRIVPLMVRRLMGGPPWPNLPRTSRGRWAVSNEIGNSEKTLPWRQRATRLACGCGGRSTSREPLVVSAAAPLLSSMWVSSR